MNVVLDPIPDVDGPLDADNGGRPEEPLELVGRSESTENGGNHQPRICAQVLEELEKLVEQSGDHGMFAVAHVRCPNNIHIMYLFQFLHF